IDEGTIPTRDLEFTLTSVDADFPDAMPIHMGKVKPGLGASTTAVSPPAVRATTTSVWPTGKAYFFMGAQYVRYDVQTDKADPDYPQPIAGRWPGFPPEFESGIDAEVMWNNGKVYFFKKDQYLRYDIASDKVEAGYPQPIGAHWPGLWRDHID